ncbi:amidohydrolase [Monashia sp. NPDC004114]
MSRVHYRGGRVFTAGETSWAESIVVDGERIAFVGATEEADRLDDIVRTVDLEGAFVVPGFVDAHTHLVSLGESLSQVDLFGAVDLADIQGRLAAAAASDPGAERLRGRSWLFSALHGQQPHRSMIDDVINDRPVYLTAADHHSAWVNSAALRELGIHRDTPDPIGGHIARDADGEATGMLYENAALILMRGVLDRLSTDADRLAAQQDAFACYLAAGVTSAIDMGLADEELTALDDAMAAGGGRLPLRVAAHWVVNRTGTTEGDLAQVARAVELHRTRTGPWFRVTGIKIFVDGVVDSCTAAMVAPFADGSHPGALWDDESLAIVVAAADAAGLQVAMHAIGDHASGIALLALEHAVEVNGPRPRRHRIEHLETVTEDTVRRLGELGVIASVQPVHADPAIQDNWRRMLGDDRVDRGFPWGELADAGASLVIGSDAPTAPYAPLPNLYVAATRRSAIDRDLPANLPDSAMRLGDALLRATRDAARSARWEDLTGRLDPGLSADFVVIDADPFRDGLESLLSARVRLTVLAGRTAYDAVSGSVALS